MNFEFLLTFELWALSFGKIDTVAKKFYIRTFGCQMNVHDSEKMAGILTGLGYVQAESDTSSDLVLFNTCSVRDHAHHKAISEVGRVLAHKKRHPELIVGVCGCVAQAEKDNLFKIYPELDLVFGPDQIYRLPEILECQMSKSKCQKNDKSQITNSKMIAVDLIDNLDEYHWLSDVDQTLITSHKSPVTEFVTIMKGCNNKCTFCIVPYVRGSEVSRPADDIVAEIKRLVERGIKEVTLLGQNVNSYSRKIVLSQDRKICRSCDLASVREYELTPFVELLRRISNETDILRIRYTSPHPKDLGDDLIEEHANNPKLCRHMHLPLQAGSDKVLREMKRSYNKKRFLERSSKLREMALGIDITTDIIVGFPGETEKDFEDTLDVVNEVKFDGMFAFKYSPRPGTVAAKLKDDVPMKEKEDRLQRLLELNAKIWKEKTAKLVGTKQKVLVEGTSKKGEQLTGRTFANKIVNFSGNLNLVGHIVDIEITGAGANSLKGELKS